MPKLVVQAPWGVPEAYGPWFRKPTGIYNAMVVTRPDLGLPL